MISNDSKTSRSLDTFIHGLKDVARFWVLSGTQCPHKSLLQDMSQLPDVDEDISSEHEQDNI